MENQTTEVQPQSEQPTDVVQNTEATAEVKETAFLEGQRSILLFFKAMIKSK